MLEKGQRLPFNLADSRESGGPVITLIISCVLRYIEHFKPHGLAFGDVLVRCFLPGRYSSCPKNIPSQPVIWFGSLLLHVTRNITRQ